MINIPIADFIIVLLIFFRIIAAFVASPIYGHQSIPSLVKVILALIISYIVFLSIDKSQITVELSIAWLFTNAVKEIINGLILGFMMNFVFYGVSYAGTLIGFDMGLSMAEVFNPIDNASENVIGNILYYASLLIFLLINGHHYIISGLVYSFSVFHLGKFTLNEPVYQLLIKYSGTVFIIAFKIASPIIVSYFLIHIAEGIIGKVIPQMQVFFVSQPLVIGVGFVMLISMVPIYLYVIKYLLKGYEDNMYTLIKAMGQ
ncbi:MAG: flagellar biosynthetic protein FliR [Ignavibacteriaceae bacterium]|nr:flagellar biosynthetic protein FliR [Ignavibacteriaceae bacterium]